MIKWDLIKKEFIKTHELNSTSPDLTRWDLTKKALTYLIFTKTLELNLI